MYRKILSLLLGVTLALSICACGGGKTQDQNTDSTKAAAEADIAEDNNTAAEGWAESYPEMGLKLVYPAEFANTKGYFTAESHGRFAKGINLMAFYYFAMPKEEYEEMMQKEDVTEEELKLFQTKVSVLCNVISIDQERGAREIIDLLEIDESYKDKFTEIGKAEDVTFYMVDGTLDMDKIKANAGEEYAQECSSLQDALIEVLKNAEFSIPVARGSEYIGQKISFETTDVNGNTVKSEDIFAQNKITMLNVWATWCSPCKGELKGLGEMSRRYAGKGVAVVGLCTDGDEKLEDCQKLLAENEVDYLNLLPFEGVEETIHIPCYPVSYFVDSEGTILAAPFEGAPPDMASYEECIDELLEKE